MTTNVNFRIYEDCGRQSNRLCYVPAHVFKQLAETYPEGVGENPKHERDFHCNLPTVDPRVQRILDILKGHGLRPASESLDRSSSEFGMRIDRKYDDTDFQNCTYMVPRPTKYFGFTSRSNQGDLIIDARKQAIPYYDIGVYGRPLTIGVSEGIYRKVIEANFSHLVLKRILASIPQSDLPAPTSLWEISSDLTLPPLSQKNRLITNEGSPFTKDMPVGCFLIEELYSPPEYHYTSSSFRSIEPFDFAITQERFSGHKIQMLITSKKFYEFCKRNQLPVDWIPVRLDPD